MFSALKIVVKSALVLGASFMLTPSAFAFDLTSASFANISTEATIPVGHSEFCQRRSGECMPMQYASPAKINDYTWNDLTTVNNYYNTHIQPMADQDLYGIGEFWTYPANGYGDCEDFVLIKRAALIERGWEPSNLLITVVMQSNGEGHAVLMVRTERGDLILDNQEPLIKVWTDTPYTYLKRQSQAHAGQWVDIQDARGAVTATASAGY